MAIKRLESQLLTFEFGDELIKDVECNIEVEDDSHWNKINVTSYNTILLNVEHGRGVNITISTPNLSGDMAKKTELINTSIRNFGMNIGHLTLIKFSVYPTEVLITQDMQWLKRKRKTSLSYYINKAPMFAPFILPKINENGDIKHKKGEALSMKIINNDIVHSDVKFTYLSKNGHYELDQHQVLTTKINKTKNIVNVIKQDISPQIKNILLLMSFLHDNKVHCVNWKAEFSNKIVWHYQSNHYKAEDIPNQIFNELIDRVLISDFFEVALINFQRSPYKEEIKNCINSLTIRKKSVIELTFLSFFQAMESLILAFKRQDGSEFILDSNDFAALRKKIENLITNELPDFKEERGKIKSKLSELNRPSLKESAQLFFKHHNIDTDDIWPMFDNKSKKITGLSTIRNVIIHGDLIPNTYLIHVATAMEHLRILLVRCVFALLEWDINMTNTNMKFLLERHDSFNPTVINNVIYELSEYFYNKK